MQRCHPTVLFPLTGQSNVIGLATGLDIRRKDHANNHHDQHVDSPSPLSPLCVFHNQAKSISALRIQTRPVSDPHRKVESDLREGDANKVDPHAGPITTHLRR